MVVRGSWTVSYERSRGRDEVLRFKPAQKVTVQAQVERLVRTQPSRRVRAFLLRRLLSSGVWWEQRPRVEVEPTAKFAQDHPLREGSGGLVWTQPPRRIQAFLLHLQEFEV